MTDREQPTRILQLTRLPVYPPTNGRERRIWETAWKLSSFGEVTIASPRVTDRSDEPHLSLVATDNRLLWTKSRYIYLWNAALFAGPNNPYERLSTRLTLRGLPDGQFDLIVAESPQVARAAVRVARRDDAALLLDKHNASFEILASFLVDTPLPEPVVSRAVGAHRAHEQWAIDAADAVVFQSDADRTHFETGDALVETIPNGTAIDRDVSVAAVGRVRDRYGLDPETPTAVFVGSYDYEPNADAARRIDEAIAPRLPDMEFLLVGRDPPATTAPNVTELGFVESLSPVLAAADVGVCPLSSGSGTKLKVMDYLAAGLPVVTTTVGAAGIDLVDGESALIRDDDEAFADAVETVVSSPETAERLSRAARELSEQYRWETVLAAYEPLVRAIV